MLRLVIGVVLFLFGGQTLLAAQEQGGINWTGGMIVGAWLAVSGVVRLRRNRPLG